MNWVQSNIGTILQAFITIIGSGIAVWISVFQQKTVEKREKANLNRQQQALAVIVMRDVLDLAITVSAYMVNSRVNIMEHPDVAEDEIMQRHQVEMPKSLTLDFDKALLIGPDLALCIIRIQVSLTYLNATSTMKNREAAQEDFGNKIRELDKLVGKLTADVGLRR